MCILSLRLGFISRFISEMRHSRSWGTIGIFSMCGRFFGGWMDGRLYHATKDGRPFSVILYIYPALGDRGRTIVLALLGTICFTLGALVALAIVAVGVKAQSGEREILGFDVGPGEDGAFWDAFLRSLVAQGG